MIMQQTSFSAQVNSMTSGDKKVSDRHARNSTARLFKSDKPCRMQHPMMHLNWLDW
jgi:hypothetical protein